jgi:hypothetical protein
MTAEFSKRALSVGIGAGALALLAQPQRASADTPFSSFAFPAMSAGAPRTMQDRLSEIKNVRDFGALGNAVTDDTAAIQAAINASGSGRKGTIFFPPGSYKITSPLTLNDDVVPFDSIIMRGCGDSSYIFGYFNGYLVNRLDRLIPDGGVETTGSNQLRSGMALFEGLRFANGHPTGGCLKLGAHIGATVRNCTFGGNQCLNMVGCQSSQVSNCVFSTGGQSAGSRAIYIDENGVIESCDITGFATGIGFSGFGMNIWGCRFEVNDVAIAVGQSISPSYLGGIRGATDFNIKGNSFESNGTAIDILSGSNFLIASISVTMAAYSNYGTSDYGIRIRAGAANNGLFSGCAVGGGAQAAISIAGQQNRQALVFISCTTSNFQTGKCWEFRSDGTGWKLDTAEFINCRGLDGTTAGGVTMGAMGPAAPTFAMLPTGAGSGVNNARVGDTYYITDGNQATAGGIVTAGGGSNKSWVTWNGTNWVRGAA